jgi:hypothetical protein
MISNQPVAAAFVSSSTHATTSGSGTRRHPVAPTGNIITQRSQEFEILLDQQQELDFLMREIRETAPRMLRSLVKRDMWACLVLAVSFWVVI